MEKRDNSCGKQKRRLRYRFLLYAGCLVFSVLAVLQAARAPFPEIAGYAVYSAAGVLFCFACVCAAGDLRRLGEKLSELLGRLKEKYRVVRRFFEDYRYRMFLFTVSGLLTNTAYALFHGFLGAAMTAALGGMVILTIYSAGGASYSGMIIYVMALYTFIKAPLAVRNWIRAKKEKTLYLITTRSIAFADACVSVLSLQTAMFASFGGSAVFFERTMNAATGAVVCGLVLGMGIYGVYSASRMRKAAQKL